MNWKLNSFYIKLSEVAKDFKKKHFYLFGFLLGSASPPKSGLEINFVSSSTVLTPKLIMSWWLLAS